jgi:hypothetical protein
MRHCWLPQFIVCFLVASSAWAQPNPPPSTSTSEPPSATATPPASPVANGMVAVRDESPCKLGINNGAPEADASTVTVLVCNALRERQAPMALKSSDANAPSYRVNLRKLGASYILEVLKEQPEGTPLRVRSMVLNSLEDATVVSKRLAESIMQDTSVENTARPGQLTPAEARPMVRRSNYPQFAIGIAAVTGTSLESNPGGGIDMALSWSTERLGGDLRFRAAGGETDLVALYVDGRYFLTDGEFAPYLGGGMGILTMSADGSHLSGSGLVGQALLGIEGSRLNNSRVGVVANVDLPTFRLKDESSAYESASNAAHEPVYSVGFGLSAYYVF